MKIMGKVEDFLDVIGYLLLEGSKRPVFPFVVLDVKDGDVSYRMSNEVGTLVMWGNIKSTAPGSTAGEFTVDGEGLVVLPLEDLKNSLRDLYDKDQMVAIEYEEGKDPFVKIVEVNGKRSTSLPSVSPDSLVPWQKVKEGLNFGIDNDGLPKLKTPAGEYGELAVFEVEGTVLSEILKVVKVVKARNFQISLSGDVLNLVAGDPTERTERHHNDVFTVKHKVGDVIDAGLNIDFVKGMFQALTGLVTVAGQAFGPLYFYKGNNLINANYLVAPLKTKEEMKK